MMLSASRGENDALTRFVAGPALNLFHWLWGKYKVQRSIHFAQAILILQKPVFVDAERAASASSSSSKGEESKLWYYSSERMQRVNMALVTVISSLTPLSSIIILSTVKNMAARLGIVCAFTLSFSLVLALATGARRVEIFAATAA